MHHLEIVLSNQIVLSAKEKETHYLEKHIMQNCMNEIPLYYETENLIDIQLRVSPIRLFLRKKAFDSIRWKFY